MASKEGSKRKNLNLYKFNSQTSTNKLNQNKKNK
jgi:hypothetical protein